MPGSRNDTVHLPQRPVKRLSSKHRNAAAVGCSDSFGGSTSTPIYPLRLVG